MDPAHDTSSQEAAPAPDIASLSPVNNSDSKSTNNTSTSLAIVLSVVITSLVVLSCYTIYRFYKNRQRSSLATQEQVDQERFHDDDVDYGPALDHPIWYIRTVGLQPSVVSSITVVRYKKGDGLIDGTECSVCLTEFQGGESLRLLPKCSHAFHVPCIDTWLRSHINCPLCRAPIVLPLQELTSTVQNLNRVDETRVDVSNEHGEEDGSEFDYEPRTNCVANYDQDSNDSICE